MAAAKAAAKVAEDSVVEKEVVMVVDSVVEKEVVMVVDSAVQKEVDLVVEMDSVVEKEVVMVVDSAVDSVAREEETAKAVKNLAQFSPTYRSTR
jgi:hypothetical protein